MTISSPMNAQELEEFILNPPTQLADPPALSNRLQDRWPSTVTQEPIGHQTLALETEKLSAAHVTGKINDVDTIFLFDTGSKASVILERQAQRLNIPITYNLPDIGLMGVGGQQFFTEGQIEATAKFGILEVPLIFYVMPEKSKYNPSFNVIMGEDSFKKLPPILYNYEENYIQIGTNVIEMMAVELISAGQDTQKSENETVKIEFGPTHATTEQTGQLFDLLNDYVDVISLSEFDLGRCTISASPIELVDETKPLASKPYRVREKAKEIIYNYIQNMLLAGLM
uniref:Peptidase A2 domain-containing protein n=1 Tax=Panagrolaimus superbus TaxID=310955 RepID=A0A914YA84_9BILA